MKKLLCALICALALTTTGLAADETVRAPSGALLTQENTLVFTDTYNHAIWERDADGTYTKLAGRVGAIGADNRPTGGYSDDDALKSAFNTPWAIAPFRDGYAISDSENNVVRYLADGQVTTLAGSGKAGNKNATGIKASFDRPTGLVSDGKGGLYVADSNNNAIRHISKTGAVTTYVGTSGMLTDPTGLAYADGILYVTDTGNHRICTVEDGKVTPLTGGSDGYADGTLEEATFSSPTGVTVYGSAIYVADTGNGAIRYLSDGVVTTLAVAEDGGLFPISPRGLVLDGGALWICDVFSHTLASVPSTSTRFEDVPGDAWYAKAVYAVKAQGWMEGTSATTFVPQGTMTRAMFAQMLYNLEGAEPSQAEMPFTDVGDTWYTDAVAWAAEEGILTGVSPTICDPDGLITRQQMVVMLDRYAKAQGQGDADLTAFADADEVAEYAYASMEWACGAGIIQGTDQGKLNPNGNVTRAEGATILLNFMTQQA